MKAVSQVAVRELAEFVWRNGDLRGERDFVPPWRFREGLQIHREIQQSRSPGYLAEQFVSAEFEFDELVLKVQGRVDGWRICGQTAEVEEIKSIDRFWTGEPAPVHWAQAKIYGALLLKQHPFEGAKIILTYCGPDSQAPQQYEQWQEASELERFLAVTLEVFRSWCVSQLQWRSTRNDSLAELKFPFPQFRAGQRQLAVAVYRAIAAHSQLFVEASTGIGKTISTLFPALKSLGEKKVEQVLYLTATTVGRGVAEEAISLLRHRGMRLRSLRLSAREKICLGPDRPCDMRVCPYAIGYYDRRRAALDSLLAMEKIGPPELEEVARREMVCPFALSMDATRWVDVIIGDFNHAFDPSASLKSLFVDEQPRCFLIDETHQLPGRAREMFSAHLESIRLRRTARTIRKNHPKSARSLDRLAKFLEDFAQMETTGAAGEIPEEVSDKIDRAAGKLAEDLATGIESPVRKELLETYFELAAFQAAVGWFGNDFRLLQSRENGVVTLQIYCLDPSRLLQKTEEERGGSWIFFSATLSPLEYFRDLLGSPKASLAKASTPFSSEQLGVFIADRVATEFHSREASAAEICDLILTFVRSRSGHYLVFFPSYAYLSLIRENFVAPADWKILIQEPSMGEKEKTQFLDTFHRPEKAATVVGWAVLGGLFGEAIDLVGDKLIGVVVVGVGLPQVGTERELMKHHFQAQGRDGFDYAYRIPGMNRVLQAVGRVIRTETDKGACLLIDRRFRQPSYKNLLPPWWKCEFIRSREQLAAETENFWKRGTQS